MKQHLRIRPGRAQPNKRQTRTRVLRDSYESLLDDREQEIDRVLQQSWLIHARVGYSQGPQVPDWRCPAFEAERDRFLDFWDRAVRFAKDQDKPLIICPEFGPAPYQAVDPHTGEPVADNREVNRSMGEFLKQRYR